MWVFANPKLRATRFLTCCCFRLLVCHSLKKLSLAIANLAGCDYKTFQVFSVATVSQCSSFFNVEYILTITSFAMCSGLPVMTGTSPNPRI